MAGSKLDPGALCALLDNYSIEMTAKDVPNLEAAADLIAPGRRSR